MQIPSPIIVPCGEERLAALVGFAAAHNREGAHHIGYFGEEEADIAPELRALAPPPEEGFRLAYAGSELVGVMGVAADPEIGRAWLYGPLVTHADWHPLADRLYAAVLPVIPPGISEQELFCDVQNLNCQAFAARHGFALRNESTILELARERPAVLPAAGVEEFDPRYFEQFQNLHNRVFPRTYYTARQVVDRSGALERLLIVAEGDILQGYIFFKVEPEAGLGYIDFLGVAEDRRRRGIANRLLAAAVQSMFSRPEVLKIGLTVTATNTAALNLYAQAGFAQARTMRGYRKRVPVA